MTNAQTKLIAAAIVAGLGAVAWAIGILAMATHASQGETGHAPGVIAMLAGLILGIWALAQMRGDKPDGQ